MSATLCPLPPMGWNSWNTFQTRIDEQLIRDTAEAMIKTGMRDAGYVYINLDDGWMERERDASGNLVPDRQKFPNGLKPVGDYLHERGFKFGIYNCAGTKTCAGYPGGNGFEKRDAELYASFGVDYLKYDWCFSDGIDAKKAYGDMADALAATGRPIVFSLCEWGKHKPWTWEKQIGSLWRTTGDIHECYDCRERWLLGWKIILDSQVGLEQFSGPGRWNDPDMLVVGRPLMPHQENKAHFSLWCLLNSPLIAGNDVRDMPEKVRLILTNKEIIALNQDPLAKQGYRYIYEADQREVWVKPLAGGDWGVIVFNTSKEMIEKYTFDFAELKFLDGKTYKVRDLWAAADIGDTTKPFEGTLNWHDVAVLRLSPA
ncbi:MAG TPA: glycoside hydrolase family 27 protein [Tepidisphaeraceae bacterium]